jgi:hypothetical protein
MILQINICLTYRIFLKTLRLKKLGWDQVKLIKSNEIAKNHDFSTNFTISTKTLHCNSAIYVTSRPIAACHLSTQKTCCQLRPEGDDNSGRGEGFRFGFFHQWLAELMSIVGHSWWKWRASTRFQAWRRLNERRDGWRRNWRNFQYSFMRNRGWNFQYFVSSPRCCLFWVNIR